MSISSEIFEAYLHCATKCWLLSHGEVGSHNIYAEWLRARNMSFLTARTHQLSSNLQDDEYVASPTGNVDFKTASWKIASDVKVKTKELVSNIRAE